MPRRAATGIQRATTQRGEDFLANPVLKAGIEALAGLVRESMPEEAESAFGAIRDGAAILAAREHEAWIVAERLRTQTSLRKEVEGAE